MTALAPAPCPRRAPPPEPDLPSIPFIGRSLADYAQCFALDVVALKGRDVLDVGAGSSSFTAEACARKINAAAVDPLYGCPADTLATRVQLDGARMAAQLRPGSRQLRMKSFPTLAAAEIDRRGAAQRFLADYETHFIHNRYVAGALPRLPFFDGSFDLVLCAHLLFLYAGQFDFDWHLAACRELARVSADQVRIHPLGGPDGRPWPALGRLRRQLREHGIASEILAVEGEFSVGGDSLLVLRRAAS